MAPYHITANPLSCFHDENMRKLFETHEFEYGEMKELVLHVEMNVSHVEITDSHAENSICERKVGVYAKKGVAAGAHLPTTWHFEPAKRADDRTGYCSFLIPQWKHWVGTRFYT